MSVYDDDADRFGDRDEEYETDDYDFDSIIKETEKAWLLSIDGERIWFPKSQCDIDIKRKLITVPSWLAEEKELV